MILSLRKVRISNEIQNNIELGIISNFESTKKKDKRNKTEKIKERLFNFSLYYYLSVPITSI